MSRSFWNAFGWFTQATFALTVVGLFVYLRGYETVPPEGAPLDGLIDAALALFFAVPHSVLLLPAVRRRLTKRIPGPMYGAFFCLVACATLAVTMIAWRPIGGAVWHLTGDRKTAIEACFYGSWIALAYSLYLAGIGFQTGWSTWRPWMRGETVPTRPFRPRSIFRVLRHPVYFSFLGLVWFTPIMSVDRAILTVVWTAYIYVGSVLKDRRMEFYVGDVYRQYAATVPGYPGMFFGPLARIPTREPGAAR
jgi:protein-S-isoprenylcysteine O-methyltransferase Ste14